MRDRVERTWQVFHQRLLERPDLWDAPTRLTGWHVSDLAAHACWGTSLEADAIERALGGVSGPAEGVSPQPSASRETVLTTLRGSYARLATALDALEQRAATDPGTAAGTLPLPYGDVPVPLALSIFEMEAGAHGSDLAAAAGEDDTLSPEVCAATFATMRVFGPILAEAAGTVPPPDAVLELRCGDDTLRFGPGDDDRWTAAATGAATTTIGGRCSDVTLFLLGRRPVDAVTVDGDPELAARFKDLVPGP